MTRKAPPLVHLLVKRAEPERDPVPRMLCGMGLAARYYVPPAYWYGIKRAIRCPTCAAELTRIATSPDATPTQVALARAARLHEPGQR
jgi:hypothetical protein